ncbi:hypothetical protein FRC11_009851 [Ceratobasidium sp. 423]|nr:hypothetical protein FRC11_009851 [Ceratobasidium sp. 423]
MPKLRHLLVDLHLEPPYPPEKPGPGHPQKILLEASSKIRLSSDFENLVLLASLEIYDQGSRHCYKVDGWHVLGIEKKAQGRPLLPNLKTLRFLNTSASHGMDESKWIQAFAPPGLKELSLTPNHPLPGGRIPFPVASVITKTLIRHCPSIQILRLAPNDDENHPANLDYDIFDLPLFRAALSYEPSQPWYQAVQALTQLRHLTISEGWFYPASLRIVGSLPEIESITVVPGKLDNFDYVFEMNRTLPDESFPNLAHLSTVGLEGWGVGSILGIQAMLRQITVLKLEFYFDDPEDGSDDQYWGMQILFQGLRNAPRLQELYISYSFVPDNGERPLRTYESIQEMGPHPELECIHLRGIRLDKVSRREYPGICQLASIWPNVRTLSMPSQSASIRELEDFATFLNLTHLTVNLDLKSPYRPEKPELGALPLKTLTSSGPVRLSTDYREISLSAVGLLRLWPSLQCVAWSDDDPARIQLAEFFNSEVLGCNRTSMFGVPREAAKLSARRRKRELKVHFTQMVEDLQEADGWNSDSDWSSESELWLSSE